MELFLEGKNPEAIHLFHYFIAQYRRIGKFELHPVKTRVALLTKMRFCSINRVGADFIDIHFVLTKAYNHNSCFHRIDNLAGRFFIHHLRIHRTSDISPEVRTFMRIAYGVGNRTHIRPGTHAKTDHQISAPARSRASSSGNDRKR